MEGHARLDAVEDLREAGQAILAVLDAQRARQSRFRKRSSRLAIHGELALQSHVRQRQSQDTRVQRPGDGQGKGYGLPSDGDASVDLEIRALADRGELLKDELSIRERHPHATRSRENSGALRQ